MTTNSAQAEELEVVLARLAEGDREAEGRLLELVQAQIRSMARRMMRAQRPGHTLQTTALVNEAWLRFSAGRSQTYQSREHFFGVAATAMRHVLVDHARSRQALRRTAAADDIHRLTEATLVDDGTQQMLEFDQALSRLAERSQRLARIVELRCFCELTVEETAAAVEISTATVKRELRIARALLEHELRGPAANQQS